MCPIFLKWLKEQRKLHENEVVRENPDITSIRLSTQNVFHPNSHRDNSSWQVNQIQ